MSKYDDLQKAAEEGNIEAVRQLLKAGASANKRPPREPTPRYADDTPLAEATYAGHGEIAQLLVDHGADPHLALAQVVTRASDPNQADTPGKIDLLIRMGADPDAVVEDERGLTTLQWAVRHGYVDAARCLLDRGARADTPGRDGSTALQIAATSGHREMLKLLREHGADVGVGDHSGRTALHSAATSGQLDTVRELLASGANIDATTSEGWTPLMGAAVHADLDTVKLLVEHGADCQSKGPGGLAVTDIAARAGNDGIVAYLRERGVPEGVMTSLASGDVEAIADGLNHGGDPNERVDGDPLICLAAERGQAGVVKLLLGRGADPSARDAENGPALMLAVEYGHDEIAEMLIKAGADVNAREPEERGTALHQVAAVTDARIATLLLERGANVNAKLRDGTRPLDLAEIQTSDEVEDLLREAGAKPGSKGGNRPVGCFAAAMLCGAAVAIVCLLT